MSFFKFVLSFVFTGIIAFANNGPTIHQVYQAVESGDLSGAHQMVEQVLKTHPDSAKAHYINAEILVRQGDLLNATNEFTNAEKLSPGLPFAKPQAVQSLKQHLGQVESSPLNNNFAESAQPNKQSIPWTMILLGSAAVVLIWLAMRSFASRNSNTYPDQYNRGNGTSSIYPNHPNGPSSGFAGGQSYPQQSGGLGGGIMSGLATGAAAGAGFVAGEELMHHFMDGSSSNNNSNPMNNTSFSNNNVQPSDNMGGSDFGLDDSASWDNSSSSDMSDDGKW